jgi:2-amino-4-hydroxy-6-hydroxymethyldihydropteridine diphosphokinase
MDHHPLVTAAASGRLPEWAVAKPRRREHAVRVAELLDSWAEELGLAEPERARWRAAGCLHDALRDAEPSELRSMVSNADALPDGLLHGPATAERLREEGVDDEELLAAIAYHTVGDPGFGILGRALYAADFLDPGRTFLAERRAEMRARAPSELDTVVRDVARERIRDLVCRGLPLDPRTIDFWNRLVAEVGTRE